MKKIAKKSVKKLKKVSKDEVEPVQSLYNKIKSNHKKDPKYKELQVELKKLQLEIQNQEGKLDSLDFEFHEIHSKELPENVVERMPIEDLHDLYGKNQHKATLNDAIRLGRIQQEIEILLDEYDKLHSKKKILEVEILQAKINNLINFGDK